MLPRKFMKVTTTESWWVLRSYGLLLHEPNEMVKARLRNRLSYDNLPRLQTNAIEGPEV